MFLVIFFPNINCLIVCLLFSGHDFEIQTKVYDTQSWKLTKIKHEPYQKPGWSDLLLTCFCFCFITNLVVLHIYLPKNIFMHVFLQIHLTSFWCLLNIPFHSWNYSDMHKLIMTSFKQSVDGKVLSLIKTWKKCRNDYFSWVKRMLKLY